MTLHVSQPHYAPAPVPFAGGTAASAPGPVIPLNPVSPRPSALTAKAAHAPLDGVQTALAPQTDPGLALTDPKKADSQEDEGFTFFDFLDIINPLQHIPVVNTLYRSITGDEIDAPAKIAGSALFGGPFGLVAGLVNYAIEKETGKDLGDHVMTALMGGEEEAEDLPNVAQGPESAQQVASLPAEGQTFPTDAQFQQAPLAPPMAAPQREGTAKGPLFSLEKGFSPYAAMTPQAPEVGAAATPQHYRQPPMFRPDPASVVKALEAQGFNTQTSHPMLNLGPSAKPGPGAGMNLGGLTMGAHAPVSGGPVGSGGLMDPALKAKLAQHSMAQIEKPL